MTVRDPAIEAAREALENMQSGGGRKTVHSVVKALLPEIEERLKTHSADEVLPAIELALGKKIAKPTFMSALCNVRKEVRLASIDSSTAAKTKRRVKAVMNGG